MPWKLFFPRNRASSYERKSHVLRANERVAWVEQRNFAVFTRYPLRESRPHPSPSINFRSPSRGRDGFPSPPSFQTSEIALFSSVSSSMRGNVSLSLSLFISVPQPPLIMSLYVEATKYIGEEISNRANRVKSGIGVWKERRVGKNPVSRKGTFRNSGSLLLLLYVYVHVDIAVRVKWDDDSRSFSSRNRRNFENEFFFSPLPLSVPDAHEGLSGGRRGGNDDDDDSCRISSRE